MGPNADFEAVASLHHGADYTPYEGLEITGWPIATMLRGRFVVRAGKLVGGKGYGRYLSRTLPLAPSSMPSHR